MNHKTPVVLAWSGGKDSAYALHQLMKDHRYEVSYLLSTINGENGRLSMHGVRETLIEMQADRIGIPLIKVYVYEANNEEYERQMRLALAKVKALGVRTVAFGDIFLEDLRSYREGRMKEIGMDCLFPLWKTDTLQLLHQFIAEGFKTYTCCVNADDLDESWCGRLIDASFVKELPPSVDPCGEHGEFHSFCFDGPLYREPLSIVIGQKIYKSMASDTTDPSIPAKGFWFCDLLSAE